MRKIKDILRLRYEARLVRIPVKLDSRSGAKWTADPA